MSKQQTRVSHPIYNLLPTEIEGFDSLAELALDMRWSWNHATDEVWRQLDPELWEITHNPWVVLQTVSRDQIERVLADPVFRKNVDDLLRTTRHAAEAPAWFQLHHPRAPLTCVAYFSMEFMLSEALPIYSGGLGNVAGDQLKAASDLGVPVVGVGLLYQQGYFRQVIDKDGSQQALFPYNDPGQLPITPLRHPNGEWLRLEIALPGYSVWLRGWQVQVGRRNFTCWTAMTQRTFLPTEGSPASCMGAGRSCASSKNCFSVSADGGCLPHWAFNRKSVTSMKGMRPLLYWSAPDVSCKKPGSPSKSHWPSLERETSSPPTRQWLPALIVSLRLSSTNTSVVMLRRSSA